MKTAENEPECGIGKVERRRRNWRKAFLATYRQTGIIGVAAEAAGVNRETIRRERAKCPKFELECAAAFEDAADYLEAHALRRAMDADKPSDLLTIFRLKAMRPNIYRDNARLEHSGPDGAPIMPVTIPTVILLPRDGFEELAKSYGEGPQNPAEPGPAA